MTAASGWWWWWWWRTAVPTLGLSQPASQPQREPASSQALLPRTRHTQRTRPHTWLGKVTRWRAVVGGRGRRQGRPLLPLARLPVRTQDGEPQVPRQPGEVAAAASPGGGGDRRSGLMGGARDASQQPQNAPLPLSLRAQPPLTVCRPRCSPAPAYCSAAARGAGAAQAPTPRHLRAREETAAAARTAGWLRVLLTLL